MISCAFGNDVNNFGISGFVTEMLNPYSINKIMATKIQTTFLRKVGVFFKLHQSFPDLRTEKVHQDDHDSDCNKTRTDSPVITDQDELP